ncbi:MAG TPA: PQQ-dependent sugar dehydrogenase, partial [Isosphaeraceae bacterium]
MRRPYPGALGERLDPTRRPDSWGSRGFSRAARWATAVVALVATAVRPGAIRADTPALLDPNLQVTTVVGSGINQPIGVLFLPPVAPVASDMLILEKASGRVLRVLDGVLQANPVLDLPVNSNSERGLLSLVPHPAFPANPSVYIRWTESSTGADSAVASEVPLTGNRVDRFVWDGSTLTFAQPILRLRSRQNDAGQPERGNHNGGVMKFGPDGKLYLFMGDQGRRGWMQNLPNGPFLPPAPDDQYGGPAPDDAHLSGVILRLNDDGTAPIDNPFFAVG